MQTGQSRVSLGWFIHWNMQTQQYRCPHVETTGSFAISRQMLHSNLEPPPPASFSGPGAPFFVLFYPDFDSSSTYWSPCLLCVDLSSISRSLLELIGRYLPLQFIYEAAFPRIIRGVSDTWALVPDGGPYTCILSLVVHLHFLDL